MGSLPNFLRRTEAAQHIREVWGLPCQPKTLAKLAVVGGGPIYRKAGRFPLYLPADLDTWAEARISAPRLSTSVPAEVAIAGSIGPRTSPLLCPRERSSDDKASQNRARPRRRNHAHAARETDL